MKVGIVGAGASGLAAAIAAAKAGAKVIVWEHNKSVGKKILATGNGKCNYTNLLMNPDCFHLKEGAAPLQVIEDFGPEDAIAFSRAWCGAIFKGWLYLSKVRAGRGHCTGSGVRS